MAPQDSHFDDEIRKARARLEAFERSTSAGELVVRLRRASPFHPFLVIRALGLVSTAIAFVLALAALIVPFLSDQIAEIVGRLDAAAGVPLFGVLGVLVLCFFVIALGAHFAALVSARSAPMLPHEAKAHQRLVSDLKQLEAQRSVSSRLTPRPALPRGDAGRPLPTRL